MCILVKAQPSTQGTWLRSPTRLGAQSQDLNLPNEFGLGHVAFLLLPDTNLLSQAGITHYSQLHDMTALTILLLCDYTPSGKKNNNKVK